MYTIVTTQFFMRRARKFLNRHPDLRPQFARVVDDLRTDPFAPHLDYHRLSGRLEGIQAVRLTHSYRITLTVVVTDKEITLLDIGSHDEVYR